MDPVRNMMMRTFDDSQQSNQNNIITVEEGMDCREAGSRFFNMVNHETKLDIIISKCSAITSCKLNGHEIIVDQRLYNQTHETWSIGDRPYQKLGALPWNCHVRGVELLLFTPNNNHSILYELTRFNELTSVVKLKSIHLQGQVIYFNLNNAKERAPVDGHTLVVQCNGNMNRIQVQNTKLLCQCNKNASILPQSLIGEIPFELMQHNDTTNNNSEANNNNINNDDLIVCDSIFSIESTCSLDFIRVRLQYGGRILNFEIRSTSWPASSVPAANQQGDVSSSTTNNKVSSIKPVLTQQATPSSSSESQMVSSGMGLESTFDDDKPRNLISAITDLPTNSCQTSSTKSQPLKALSSLTASHPSTILRARVRVTNFGVCIMPVMMTNYCCTYKFT